MKKRILSLTLVLLMVLTMLPLGVYADDLGKVRVIIENTVYTEEQGAPWDGVLVDKEVKLNNESTMMSCVVEALDTYSQTGAESNYISEINGLKAMDYDEMSGWMGTLNDWFTNEGFGAFTVEAGTLNPNDEIRIMFSLNWGEDIGGSWNNNDKTVEEINFSEGVLDKIFDKDTHEYTLTLPEGTESVLVTPTATNKNFQVRTIVDSQEYKRLEQVPVQDGTVIKVKCGDTSWPTMNEAADVPAEEYTFTVSINKAESKPYVIYNETEKVYSEKIGTLNMGMEGDLYYVHLPFNAVFTSFSTLENPMIAMYYSNSEDQENPPNDEDFYTNDDFKNVLDLFVPNSAKTILTKDIKGFLIIEAAMGEGVTYCYTLVQIDTVDNAGGGDGTGENQEANDWDGDGTLANPYLLKTSEDLQLLSSKSAITTFEGSYFKFTDDITLPTNWTPIGTSDVRFNGNIDGDNHTLTIPKGERTMLGVTKEAVLKNLKIYGEQIEGNGVVDSYITGAQGKTTITIENVTLKSGSKTLGSGFIGGYSHGNAPIFIRNCTVESDVTIGYTKDKSNIGSFGGDFNGTIIGSKSYADVYGVNFVGGISGSKGQTMGDYVIADCTFGGTVNATGDNVGGISGSGYGGTSLGVDSAPNTPCATILNCLVSGDVTGNDNVGGILGSELGVKECWNNGVGYIQNNLFAGTIKATAENAKIGGIIGYFSTINNMNVISNNFYKKNCGAEKGIGDGNVETTLDNGSGGTGWNKYTLNGDKYGRNDDPLGKGADKLSKSCTENELNDGTILNLLNNGKNISKHWISGESYPTLSNSDKHLVYITSKDLSTMNGVSQKVSGNVLEGKTLKLHYNDGTTDEISATDEKVIKNYTVSGALVGKSIPASILYDGHEFVFNLTIKPDEAQGEIDVDTNTINVTFTLLGDIDHGDITDKTGTHTLKSKNLEIWIPEETFEMPKDSTVEDLFKKALSKYNLKWKGDGSKFGSTYISHIQIPDSSEYLGEFTNGNLSGWMYTVNGKHPDVGITLKTLKDGDDIIFHYTDDYTKEEGSEKWSGGGSDASEQVVETPESIVKEEVKSTITGDTAKAQVNEKTIENLTKNADEKKADTIVIVPETKDNTKNIEVALPTTALSEMAKSNEKAISVETNVGSVTIPSEALSSITEQAKGKEISIEVKAKEIEDIKDSVETTIDEKTLEGAIIVEVNIVSDNSKITSFGGNDLTLTLPASKEHKTGERYVVFAISDDGTVSQTTGLSTKDGIVVTTSHLTSFVVTDKKAISFTDIENHWAKAYIEDVATKDLMKGVSETTFAPNATMTRAMFVTVLYRIEGEPKVSECKFGDVEKGSWYENAVAWANENGIVSGVSDTEFAPNSHITREQMATIIFRYAKFKGNAPTGAWAVQVPFTDLGEASDYAGEAIMYCYMKNIMTGDDNNKLNPKSNATRAETATMLVRMIDSDK